MKREDVQQRETKLCSLLQAMADNTFDAESDNALQEVISQLHEIYDLEGTHEVYRHSYSKMFILLSSLHKQASGVSNEILNQNLERLYFKIQQMENETPQFKMAVYKLYDHINLDIARIHFLEKENEDYYGTFLKDYNSLRNDFQESRQNFEKTGEGLRKQLERSKIDVVAILGIFSAIIIGLVSSTAFSSQILAHAHELSSGNVMIAVSLCGFVTISVFWLVFLLLSRIIFPEAAGLSKAGNWFLTGAGVVLFTLFVAGLATREQTPPQTPQSNPVTINQQFNSDRQ